MFKKYFSLLIVLLSFAVMAYSQTASTENVTVVTPQEVERLKKIIENINAENESVTIHIATVSVDSSVVEKAKKVQEKDSAVEASTDTVITATPQEVERLKKIIEGINAENKDVTVNITTVPVDSAIVKEVSELEKSSSTVEASTENVKVVTPQEVEKLKEILQRIQENSNITVDITTIPVNTSVVEGVKEEKDAKIKVSSEVYKEVEEKKALKDENAELMKRLQQISNSQDGMTIKVSPTENN